MIESMFSTVRDCEGNIKRYRDSMMMQRWLASALLYCEKGFYRVREYALIKEVMATIVREEADNATVKVAA